MELTHVHRTLSFRPAGRAIGVLAVTTVVVTLAACGGGHEVTTAESAPPLDVRTASSTRTSLGETFEAGGVIQARTTATLVSRIMAPIKEIRVQPGDRVRQGQVLIVLDSRDLDANAQRARTGAEATAEGTTAARSEQEAAKAALTLARATHRRVSDLHGKKSATTQELDQAVAALQAAEARLASAEARVREAESMFASARAAGEVAAVTASFARVTAPFDGVVTEKLAETGNMAAPGTPLVRLEDRGGFRLEAKVDESRAAFVSTGNPATVVVTDMPSSAGGRAAELLLEGTVSEVARAVDADARSFLVKVALPSDAPVRTGMFGRVRFAGPLRATLTVPASAVRRQGQVASVFVVDGDRARLRLVNVGTVSAGRAEVLAGLSEGEQVVVEPPPQLSDGRRVRTAGRASVSPQGSAASPAGERR